LLNHEKQDDGNLTKCGRDGNEEGGSGPEESTERDDMGTIVTGGEADGERVTCRLNDRSEEGERPKSGGIGMEGFAHFFVYARQD